MIGSGLALLAVSAMFIRWTAHRVDRQMREEVFMQAEMVAQALDSKNVAALTGTPADLASPDYQRLKEQFTLIRKANPKCRFLYLMGRKPDGKIFFYVDSEDPESPDYSPPGQLYGEASDDDYRVFNTGAENVDTAPYKDRWGVWITAEVPVYQPDTHEMLAVFGMDFNASSWKWDVATKTTLPAAPALVSLLFGIYFLTLPLRTAWS